jgi:starch synthase
MAALRILMVTAEYAPFAKVGGLADMCAGLAAVLAEQGHEVMVVLPDYGNAAAASDMQHTEGGLRWSMREEAVPGVQVLRVIAPDYFGDGPVYLGDDRDALNFLALAHAALAHAHAVGFRPDVIHAHDWHAAAAVIAPSPWTPAPPTLLSIHNIGYQGVFGRHVLADSPFADLADALADPTTGEPRLNFLAAAIAKSTAIGTVSPTHAAEIMRPEYGAGLDGLLRSRADQVHGILNGADYGLWSPERDTLIAAQYSRTDRRGKRRNREALLRKLELPLDETLPLICMITRLTEQKGLDLLLAALPELLAQRAFGLVVLGQGEAHYTRSLSALAVAHPERLQLCLAHDEQLAHQLLAGSDMLLMPSRYEPCGLTQLYAMRFGTIPVVRATGGLADSVQHFDRQRGDGNGVVFLDYDVQGLNWGLNQALDWFGEPALWQQLIDNAMAEDFSWRRQGPHYEALYRQLAGR